MGVDKDMNHEAEWGDNGHGGREQIFSKGDLSDSITSK